VARALLPATLEPASGLWAACAADTNNFTSLFNLFNSLQIIAASYGDFQSLAAISRLEAI
jgi:hypothetical protein